MMIAGEMRENSMYKITLNDKITIFICWYIGIAIGSSSILWILECDFAQVVNSSICLAVCILVYVGSLIFFKKDKERGEK